jgi:hypothetical protein
MPTTGYVLIDLIVLLFLLYLLYLIVTAFIRKL